MNLPVLIPDLKLQRFTCQGCTNCCRHLVVHLTPADRAKIDGQGWSGRMSEPAYIRLGSEYVLNHSVAGGCVFLQPDGKCRIHAEFGGTQKPLACQLYPFTLNCGGGAIRAAIRFDCPTVVRNTGEKLSTHGNSLERISTELGETAPQTLEGWRDRFLISPGRPAEEPEVAALVGAIDSWLVNPEVSLQRRLEGLCTIVETLRAARLHRLDAGQFTELVRLLFTEAVASEDTAVSDHPTIKQKRMLLQAVYSHCEQIDLSRARRSKLAAWSYRVRQAGRARKLSAGTGPIPPLVPGMSGITHEKISGISADESQIPAIDGLMTRYVRARVLSRSTFGHGYYGWSMLDGLEAMVLSFAVVGWLARYLAAQKNLASFGLDECGEAIAIVDRAAGRVPELGSRSARLRQAYLREDHGLSRLIHTCSLTTPDGKKS